MPQGQLYVLCSLNLFNLLITPIVTPKLGNLCSDELILLPSFLLRNAIEVKIENLSGFVFREGHRPWLQIDADSTDGCFHP